MKSLRSECTGHWPVHFSKTGGRLAAALLAASALLASQAGAQPIAAPAAAAPPWPLPSRPERRRFLQGPQRRASVASPAAGDAAQQLMRLLGSASIDGLNRRNTSRRELHATLQTARGKNKRKEIERADQALSEAFVAYVRDLRQDPGVGITWVDPQLRPTPPTPLAALLRRRPRRRFPSMCMTWDGCTRSTVSFARAIAEHQYSDDEKRQVLELNLKRTRILPAGKQRYVLVNAAQQRLFMYENGKQVDRWSWSSARRNIRRRCSPPTSAMPRSTLIGTCRPISRGTTSASS